jgi:hypothetical protein
VVDPLLMKKGLLKLHIVEAHLQFSDAGFLQRMSPFVFIRVNMQEWRSAVCIDGGRNPRWRMQFMEIPVLDVLHEVYIEVRDEKMLATEMIGCSRVKLNMFCIPGGMTEWIELFLMGMPAGRI